MKPAIASGGTSPQTNRPEIPLPHTLRLLKTPIVFSPSTGQHVARLSGAALRELLARAREQHKPAPIKHRLLVIFYGFGVFRALALRLENALLRLARRHTVVETLLPSIRKRGQEAAALDRLDIESGEGLLSSAPAILVRGLRSYQKEWPLLVVIHPLFLIYALFVKCIIPLIGGY